MKPKILFILHLPPPVHGSSMVGQYIKDSKIINTSFVAQYINLSTSKTVDEIGKYPILKIGSCLLYTSPSPRDRQKSRMPSSA